MLFGKEIGCETLNNHDKTKLKYQKENAMYIVGRQGTDVLLASETQGNYKLRHLLPII